MSRIYEPIWKSLKTTGKASLKIDIAHLENEEKTIDKIIKAIIKEKYNDIVFKRKNPNCRITSIFYPKESKLVLKLTNFMILTKEF